MPESFFPTGYFFIRNVQYGKVLDVEKDSTLVGAQVVLYDRKHENYDNQLWKYEDGLLVNKNSGLFLEVAGYDDGDEINYPVILTQGKRGIPPADINQLWFYRTQMLFPYDPRVAITPKDGRGHSGNTIVVDAKRLNDPKFKWSFDRVSSVGR